MTTHLEKPAGMGRLQPVQGPCPHCSCCSAALCRKGRASVRGCAGSTAPAAQETVAGCACSAAGTRGTAAWRDGMVTATLQAADQPLPGPVEDLLRLLTDGPCTVEDPHRLLLALQLRGFVQSRDGLVEMTDFGRAYLAARDGTRRPVRGRVTRVDREANTARITLDLDERPQTGVTVLLDQLAAATGIDPDGLPGVVVDAEANTDAKRPREIVLTGIRARPAPLPDQWRATPAANWAGDAR